MADPSGDFEEYWTRFVRAHMSRGSRRLRFAAVSAGLACTAAALATRRAGLLCIALVVAVVPGFGALRASRLALADLPTNVLFATLASLRLWEMTVLGTMEAEVGRIAGTTEDPEPSGRSEQPSMPQPNMVTDHTLH